MKSFAVGYLPDVGKSRVRAFLEIRRWKFFNLANFQHFN
jgi:hypothetical protein